MTQVGINYGQALYDLAAEENLTEKIQQELVTLQDAFSSEPAFVSLLASHSLSKEERCDILDESFRGKLQPYVLNFLKILTEKGYIRHFADCCKAYRDLYNADHGILPVSAVTAVAMTPEQVRKLTGKLSQITGKTVELTNRVDPQCLGGVRLDYDGKRLDDTVSHRLDAVRSLLKNTVL